MFSNSPLGYQALRARHVARVTSRLRQKNDFPSERHRKLTNEVRVCDHWLAEHEPFEAAQVSCPSYGGIPMLNDAELNSPR